MKTCLVCYNFTFNIQKIKYGVTIMIGKFFSGVQKIANNSAGNNYRDIYFNSNPGDEHTCRNCRSVLNRTSGTVTIDHIVPQKAHGTNAISNLQVLCRSCNSKKKAIINELTLKYSGQALARELRNLIKY